MKKITSILLTLTFVLYLGGIEMLYWVRMSTHKQETEASIQRHKMPKDNSVKLSFSSLEYSSLNWSEQNKEFTYQGQRYDIIGIQYCSDEIIVTCYSDKEETNLVNAFTGFVKKMFSSPQHSNNNNTDLASKIYKEYLPSESFNPSYFPRVLISTMAKCVLVDVSTKVDTIWHPPTVA